MKNNRKWLEVAEYISIIGSAVGAGLAVILEHVAYVAAPVTLSLLLNLLNRQKLEQEYRERNTAETSPVTQQLSEDIEALRSSVLAMAADVAFNRIEESIEELAEEISTSQKRLIHRMDSLESIDINQIQEELGQLHNQSSYSLESLANILGRLDNLPVAEKIDSMESRLTRIITEMITTESMHLEAIRSGLEQVRSQYEQLQLSMGNVKHQLENVSTGDSLENALSQLSERITALHTEMQTRLADLNIEGLQTTSTQLDGMRENIAQLSAESASLLKNIVNVTQGLENVPVPSSAVTPERFESAIAQITKKIDIIEKNLKQPEENQSQNLEPIIAEISQLRNQYAAWEARGPGESKSEKESQWLRSQMEILKNQYSSLQSSLTSLQAKTAVSKTPESSSLSDKAEKWLGNMIQGIEGKKPSKSTPEIELEDDDDLFDDEASPDDDLFDDEDVREDSGAVAPATPEDENREWKCVHTLTGSASVVRSIALSPDGKTIVSGDYEAIGVWDISTGQLRQTLKLDAAEISVSAIALSPDGKTVAGATGEIEIWDLGTGERVQTLESEDWTTVVAIGPDGQKMASGGADPVDQNGSVQLWNFATSEVIRTSYCVEREIYALAFSADGQMLAVGGGNPEKEKGILQLWHVNSDKPLCNLELAVTVYAVAITPDGQMLVGGCGDNSIKIWNPATSGLVQTLSGHAGKVYAIAISRDGKLLASGSGDEKIKIWNLETGEIVDTLSGHTGGVRTIAFSSDGQTLVSGAQDMTMKIWQHQV